MKKLIESYMKEDVKKGEFINESEWVGSGVCDGFEYDWYGNGTVLITGYYGETETVRIPEVMMGMEVKGIAHEAFMDCERITFVSIPESVVEIGFWAFYQCYGLKEIQVGKNVTEIGEYAFYGTPWLKEKQERISIVTMNGLLIDGTTAKGEIKIPDTVKKIGNYAFCGSEITGIELPDGLTDIGCCAFLDCYQMGKVSVPKSVTYIGRHAFSNTSWIEGEENKSRFVIINGMCIEADVTKEDVCIPNGVTYLSERLFAECEKIKKVRIPYSVEYIGKDAFYDCHNLTGIYVSPKSKCLNGLLKEYESLVIVTEENQI